MLNIIILTIAYILTLTSGQEGDEQYWTGIERPEHLKWDKNPGPCYPPEVPECRGEPYYNCLQWWIPCGNHGRDPNTPCCWSQGPMNTSSCRQPLHNYGETLGKKEYFYCLPYLDEWALNLNHHIDYVYHKTPGDLRSGGRTKATKCKRKRSKK